MRFSYFTLVIAVTVIAGCAAPDAPDKPEDSPLYPPIEPYESGYLAVSDEHELYWEQSGNPDGFPVIAGHDSRNDEFITLAGTVQWIMVIMLHRLLSGCRCSLDGSSSQAIIGLLHTLPAQIAIHCPEPATNRSDFTNSNPCTLGFQFLDKSHP